MLWARRFPRGDEPSCSGTTDEALLCFWFDRTTLKIWMDSKDDDDDVPLLLLLSTSTAVDKTLLAAVELCDCVNAGGVIVVGKNFIAVVYFLCGWRLQIKRDNIIILCKIPDRYNSGFAAKMASSPTLYTKTRKADTDNGANVSEWKPAEE